MKSETQLDYIKTTKGMFGHGIAGADSRSYGDVTNNCAGTSRTVAQGLDYVSSRLGASDERANVAFGTDWNALLGGPGPRFGPMAGDRASKGSSTPGRDWAADGAQRAADRRPRARTHGVRVHATCPATGASHRFRDTGLFTRTPRCSTRMRQWATKAASCGRGSSSEPRTLDLDDATLAARLLEPAFGYAPALESREPRRQDVARRRSRVERVGLPPGRRRRPQQRAIPWPARASTCRTSSQWIPIIEHLWDG